MPVMGRMERLTQKDIGARLAWPLLSSKVRKLDGRLTLARGERPELALRLRKANESVRGGHLGR